MPRRETPRPELRCPTCQAEVERFWSYCGNCGRRFQWRDAQRETGAECRYCRWMVSDSHAFCPWCGRDIRDADSSLEPLKAPKGFLFHKRCKRCRGGLMYPMQWCPWCGRSQAFTWGYYQFQNICPQDRKSTRLNSSHVEKSYAVFCLKKKKKKKQEKKKKKKKKTKKKKTKKKKKKKENK